jgi:hypothetical protein
LTKLATLRHATLRSSKLPALGLATFRTELTALRLAHLALLRGETLALRSETISLRLTVWLTELTTLRHTIRRAELSTLGHATLRETLRQVTLLHA